MRLDAAMPPPDRRPPLSPQPQPDKVAMLDALSTLHDVDDVIELRAIFDKSRKRTDVGYFDCAHWDTCVEEAARLNRAGAAVYVTLNPVDPQLLSRYSNRVREWAPSATPDREVVRRRWLLVDIDPIRPTDTSATTVQLAAAQTQADTMRAFLREQGWPEPISIMSGNGRHLIYPLDLPNDEASRDLVKGALAGLAARFDDAAVKVDQTVFNAARITKLPGTVAQKGDHTPHAPHRLAVLEDAPGRDTVVSAAQLRALCPTPDNGSRPVVRETGARTPTTRERGSPFDLGEFLERLGTAYTRDMHEGRERYRLAACPFDPDHVNGEAAIFRSPDGKLAFKCQHNSCADKHWRDVRALLEGPRAKHGHPSLALARDGGDVMDGPIIPFDVPSLSVCDVRDGTQNTRSLTELGNAQRLFDAHSANLRYVPGLSAWLVWDGTAWHWDNDSAQVCALAARLPSMIYHEGAGFIGTADFLDAANHFAKWSRRSASRYTAEAAVRLLSNFPQMRLALDAIDADPYLVGFDRARQVIDLRTGTTRPATRADYVTRSLGVDAVGEATRAERWTAFLDEVFDDEALIGWLARFAGYTLTGSTQEHVFLFCHGKGNNGKGVMMELIKHIMGDYAKAVTSETLTDTRRHAGAATPDLADLIGARLALCAETQENVALAEPLVKGLVAGDSMAVRKLHCAPVQFVPQLKLWMSGNHKPVIRGTDYGMWRRVRLIPFNRVFAPDERDPQLTDKLKREASHILAWMISGCVQWQQHGLGDTPDAVSAATHAYQVDQDVMGMWLSECTRVSDYETTSGALYASYKAWCLKTGAKPASQIVMGRRLGERGYAHRPSNGQTWWKGLSLKEPLSTYDSDAYERAKWGDS
jgi:P4 family phage/plasmid primase-like protien